jgi:hypothetical protein
VIDQTGLAALCRNGSNTLDLLKHRWLAVLNEAHE